MKSKTKVLIFLTVFCVCAFSFILISDKPSKPETAMKVLDYNKSNADSIFNDLTPEQQQAVLQGVDREQVLNDYLEWAQYPPDSRPLKITHTDQLDFRTVKLAEQTMPVKKDGRYVDSGYGCLLQPLHHSVTAGETMHLMLHCRDKVDHELKALDIRQLRTKGKAGVFDFQPAGLTYNDDGTGGDEKAGDMIYTFEFIPIADDWGNIHVTIEFQIEGDENSALYKLSAHFFSSPEAPAVFTGKFKEKIRNGSLYIRAEVRVFKPGEYMLAANLFAGNEPVAFSRTEAELTTGFHMVEFEFFGKVLTDAGLDGPYQLSGLRGSLNTDAIQVANLTASPEEVAEFLENVEADRPSRMLVPYFKGEYTTAGYGVGQFSDDEYTSAAKDKRVELLETGEL